MGTEKDGEPEISPMIAAEKEKLRNAYRAGGIEILIGRVIELSAQVLSLTQQVSALREERDSSSTGLEHRLSSLESTLRVMSAYPSETVEIMMDHITVLAEMSLKEASGFQKLEYTKDGLPYRWTGPTTTSSLVLLADRQETKTLALNICNFSLKANPPMVLRVDGQPLPWSTVEKLDGFTSHQVTLPARAKKQPTLVELEVEDTWRPTEKNPESKDHRQLGVAFHSLVVSR